MDLALSFGYSFTWRMKIKTRHHTSSRYLPVILLLLQFSRMKYWVYRLKTVTFTLSWVKPKVFSRHLHKDSTVISTQREVSCTGGWFLCHQWSQQKIIQGNWKSCGTSRTWNWKTFTPILAFASLPPFLSPPTLKNPAQSSHLGVVERHSGGEKRSAGN